MMTTLEIGTRVEFLHNSEEGFSKRGTITGIIDHPLYSGRTIYQVQYDSVPEWCNPLWKGEVYSDTWQRNVRVI